jgi:hypothetical protein
MSYLKNMISGMNAIEIVPHNTIYVPNPAFLIVRDSNSNTVADKLYDSSITTQIWQGTTDGAATGQLVDGTQNFLLNSTQAQAGSAAGAGKFIKEGNVILNSTDATEHIVLNPAFPNPNAQVQNAILVNVAVPFNKAYTIEAEGFKSKLGVKAGDIVVNEATKKMALVTAVTDDRTLELDADIFQSTAEKYSIYGANPPSSKGQGNPSYVGDAEGCLIYVGTSTEFKQDITASGGGTDDPRYVDIKVKTVGGEDVQFNNFPVGEVLPVQVVQVFETPTITNARLIAIW